MDNKKFSFKGWNLGSFAKGRKKLFVTMIGAMGTFIVTNRPDLAVVVGSVSELLFAVVEYYVKGK